MKNYNLSLYFNTVRENARNTKYPYRITIECTEDLKKAIMYDHVCAEYRNSYRKNINFIQSDCNMFDVDNSDSDNPDEWITPDDIKKAFPNVPFYISYSRNNMKPKDGKQPRPKFHVYFPDVTINDFEEYKKHKEAVCRYFQQFDPNAKDAARFFYGVEKPQVEFYSGDVLLYDFMKTVHVDIDREKSVRHLSKNKNIIPEGQRNTTLHRFALRVLTRYGDKDTMAYQSFIKESERCSPPLDNSELKTIWDGAVSFYNQSIRTSSDYVSPKKYKDEFMTLFDIKANQSEWIPIITAQIADILNTTYHSLHISSVNVGKQLIPRIEKRIEKVFKRVKSNGKRFIFCPPLYKNYNYFVSEGREGQ